VDAEHPGVGVEQDGGDGEQHEGERDVEEAGAQGREEEEDDADRRDGAPRVGHGDDEERAAPAVAEPQPERQRDRGGDPDGDEGDEQVLAQQRQQLAAADLRAARPLALGDDELQRVAEAAQEGEGHAVLTRVHGVSRRWAPSRMASSPTAIRTHSALPTAMFEMNSFWEAIWSPSPPAPAKVGSASGSSTRHSSWRSVRPMPRPASRASSGTPSRPSTVLRKRMSRVYAVRAMIAVVLPRPVIGSSRKKKARL